MKRVLYIFCGLLLMACLSTTGNAQTLIHYWSFNNMNAAPQYTPNAAVIPATYSIINTALANVFYQILPGAVSTYDSGYYDTYTGDLTNIQQGDTAGFALRARNPTDSVQLVFGFPTTGYKNIVLKYGVERSSAAGPAYLLYDYSLDNGTTWLTSGLSVAADTPSTSWGLALVSLTADTNVNNRSNVLFRIRFDNTTVGMTGNERFDNLTVEGDSLNATVVVPTNDLIHYWSFNNVDTTPHYIPNTPAINASYSVIDTNGAVVLYKTVAGTSAAYDSSYYDNYTGDILNVRLGYTAGNSLRARNPSDSMQLLAVFPTTGYKNIILQYETEKSSSGPLHQLFDYSYDGGATWHTSGLSVSGYTPTTSWSLVTINLTTDTNMNNKASVMFRIQFQDTTTGTSGNTRFDNMTVEGDPIAASAVANVTAANNACVVYPNPAGNNLFISTTATGAKTVSVYNVTGQLVSKQESNEQLINVAVAHLAPGTYYAIVHTATNVYKSKFVKN